MKGDFSRLTFDPQKHYSAVRMQQGRVQLDADWNENLDILRRRIEAETIDVIGECGVPMDDAAFGVVIDFNSLSADEKKWLTDQGVSALASGDFFLTQGRAYIDGLQVENDHTLPFSQQPFVLPKGKTLPDTVGIYLLYLNVWERHITALEDPAIREVAVGGPDTATRTQIIWQAVLTQVGNEGDTVTCVDDIKNWPPAPSKGRLSARAHPEEQPTDPCPVPPGAGYKRVENQLYRVEIHKSGAMTGGPTFKWSRDNGSIVVAVAEFAVDGANEKIRTTSLGRDDTLGLHENDWVEVLDDAAELAGQPGTLAQITRIDPDNVLTLSRAITGYDLNGHAKMRRWDSSGDIAVTVPATNDGYLELEDGVEIKFEIDTFHTGDYWLIPARTLSGDVEWPKDNAATPQPLPLLPAGIIHHYCHLAILELAAGKWQVVEDCRQLFPPLTELTSFFYVGGDGQEAMPGNPLPQLLQVGLMNGAMPVENASVLFAAQDTAGHVAQDQAGLPASTNSSIMVKTGADGVAGCAWRPNPDVTKASQQLFATLLDSAGNPTSHPPIRFNAQLSIASQVAYDPAKCGSLAGVTNVQDAIDALCQIKQEGSGGCCCVTVGEGGDFPSLDEAIKALIEKNPGEICICLLPGKQPDSTSGLSIIINSGTPPVHLKIEGCGKNLIVVRKPWAFSGLASFALEDVELEFLVSGQKDPLIQFTACAEVSFESCRLSALSQTVLLMIEKANRIHLENNVIGVKGTTGASGSWVSLAEGTPAAKLWNITDAAQFRQAAVTAANEFVSLSAAERKTLAQRIQQGLTGIQQDISADQTKSFQALAQHLNRSNISQNTLLADLENIRAAAPAAPPAAAALGAAVVIADANANTLFDNNRIQGAVSFYGMPGDVPNEKLIEQLKVQFRDAKDTIKLAGTSASLYMTRNHLGQLVIGQEMVKTIQSSKAGSKIESLFEVSFFTDNVFEALNNLYIVEHLAMTSNLFKGNDGDTIGLTIDDDSTFVGNRALGSQAELLNVTQDSSKAGNVRILIQDL